MDDNKKSHVNDDAVSSVTSVLEERFGKMTVTRGDKHDFLGTHLRHHRDKKMVENDMSQHIKEAISDFGEPLKSVKTPARSDLLHVDPNAKQLPIKKKKLFHSIVMKLMFVAIRSRRDIHPTVGFLSSRVQDSTVEDYGKLRRLMCYLHGTVNETSFIGAVNLHAMHTPIDVSYASHDDCKSHTGGASSFGIGLISSKSSKQKLNTTSSTEAELVGMSDCLPKALSHKQFMEAQGCPLRHNMMLQDNKSTMIMANNGHKTCSKRSRHIRIRHFYITDLIEKGEVEVRYCPSEKLLADFFSKPLQGNLFQRFKDVILGKRPLTSLYP